MSSPNSQENDAVKIVQAYRERLLLALESIDGESILALVNQLLSARESGATVFVIGNGGSASTANHFAIDWMLGSKLANPPLKVLSLSESVSSITATGNDLEFSEVFSRQLMALAKERDVLVAISASGNSPNIISAVKAATRLGLYVVGITGFDGGQLMRDSNLSIHVSTAIGDYGVAEDLHLSIGHMVKEVLISGGVHDT